MRRRVSLYIGDALVDTNDQSFILSNYTTEDLFNPSVVKNSYTQQITLPGTPKNNKIFGDIYRLDRIIRTDTSEVIRTGFSPAYKTPFVLRDDNGTVLQRGYIKLESISRKGANIQYKVTLYGGLGSLLYDLSYDSNGNKRTLADLDYFTGGTDELNFIINAQAVSNAWATDTDADTYTSIWQIVNFAPAYNGVPDGNFAPQVAIGVPSDYGLADTVDGYGTRNGYALFKLVNPADEWAVKDLRSYLQRPVLSVRALMKALAKSENNGGHSLDLQGIEDNAPFRDLWLTLPLLPSIGSVKKKSGTLGLQKVVVADKNGGYIARFNVTGTVASGATISVAMSNDFRVSFGEVEGNRLFFAGEEWQTVCFVQAEAYDSDNAIVGGSLMRCYCTPEQSNPTVERMAQRCAVSSLWGYENSIRRDGIFIEDNGTWLLDDTLDFSITAQNVDHILIKIVTFRWNETEDDIMYDVPNLRLFRTLLSWDVGYANIDSNILSSTVSYTTLDTLRSNTDITKAMLMSTSQTPADYLLGLVKVFGLYFVYDEETDTTKVMPRQDFFNTGEAAIDITDIVDTSKEIVITPFTFNAKWYELGFGSAAGAFAEEYETIWGIHYGVQRINTGYDFNNETQEIFQNVVYKNAASTLQHSRYWNVITSGGKFQPSPFVDKGNKYTLWNGTGETKEIEISCPPTSATIWYYNALYNGYDVQGAAKIDLADAEGKGVAGEDILLYRDGITPYPGFRLTDDTPAMDSLNNGVPCWLLGSTSLVTITIPNYRRYKFTGTQITSTLDFNVPKEMDIPNVTYDESCTLYRKYWQTYIADRYDLNTKVMRCRVQLDKFTVNGALLRRFFFFDGSYWVLNRIINHSRTTWDATDCEFVQVQNMNHYISGQDY